MVIHPTLEPRTLTEEALDASILFDGAMRFTRNVLQRCFDEC